MNIQNQGQQAITAQNAQAANAQLQQEIASELAQSTGQISQYLLSQSKNGFEFGTFGPKNANSNFNQNSELNQSNGQISQILAKESR